MRDRNRYTFLYPITIVNKKWYNYKSFGSKMKEIMIAPQLDVGDYINRTRRDVESCLLVHVRLSLGLRFHPLNKTQEAMEYALLSPGHRWRPILSLALGQEYGNDHPNLLPLSCGIEFFHAASLILDDLPSADNATLRRGQPTCHLKYGEVVAKQAARGLIKHGDLTVLFCSPENNIDLITRAYDVKRNAVDAQIADLDETPTSIQDVLRMIDGKSVGPYAFAVHVGVASADGNLIKGWNEQAITDFGRNIGRAYQIADDIGDVVSSPEEVGKDVGQDKGKITSVSLLGLEEARREAAKYKQNAMRMVREKRLLVDLLDKMIVIP